MKKLSYKEKYESYRARIDSESYHKLTREQEKRGKEFRKKYMSKEFIEEIEDGGIKLWKI